MAKKNKLKIAKDPNSVGALKRRAMHTNASTMKKEDWEKKYKGYSYSDFHRGG
tara:strand:- start:211 stop:369 length:159 start_codon:yes stop_codon:yes gene_type:complete